MKKVIALGGILVLSALLLSGSGCGQEERNLSETEKQFIEMNDYSTVDRSEGAKGLRKRAKKMKKLKKQLDEEKEASDAQLENMPPR